MMKNAFRCVQIVLLLFGVFGADEDEVKSVSVMEGDSVTLHTDLTQIKKFYLLEWRFGDPVIAQIDGIDISYPIHTEIFRGRLQLDQTGSLTIKNMKTKHSGLYELQISHSAGTTDEKFNVTVYESVSVAGKSEMKSVSLMEGDRVTLQTDVTLSGDELIVWRFGDEGELIAKADIEAKSSPLYHDGRFGGRLELEQTGSLIITNTRTTDSGFYTVKISSRAQTVNKRFTVTISEPGLSPAAVAGIVVAVLVLVWFVAAAAVGVIYFRRKISELQKQTSTVTVREGGDVILKPDKEIKKDDEIQWMFGEGEQQASIAELRGETGEIVPHDDVTDGRFRGRLELDEMTGSLIIKNSTTAHSGLYTLRITSSGVVSRQRFILTVNATVSVKEGEDVILKPNKEIKNDDEIQWMFGDEKQWTRIAKYIGEKVEYDYDADDKRFRGKLELDKTTGSLTIRNSRTAHSGLYTLHIISSRVASQQTFILTVNENVEEKPVEDGGSVTLNPDTEIQRDDLILWTFGDKDSLIAQLRGGTGETYDDDADGRFRGRLELNETTESLTITRITPAHTGLYKLLIINSRETVCYKFKVFLPLRHVPMTVGDPVHLSTGLPKIQRDDVIQWWFGDDSLIAEIKEWNGETSDVPDKRFRDRLKLNDHTGDLTIKNSTAEHAGDYNLKIHSSEGDTNRTYIVTRGVAVTNEASGKPLMKGKNGNESVYVNTPLLDKEVPDGVNESVSVEMQSLLDE